MVQSRVFASSRCSAIKSLIVCVYRVQVHIVYLPNLGIYFKEGSYDNVDYDGCTYDNSLLSLIEETSDKLVFMQVTSNGTNNGSSSSCEGDDVTVTFEVLSDDLIRLTRSYDGVGDSLLMTKENSSFSFSGCVDGPSNGILL